MSEIIPNTQLTAIEQKKVLKGNSNDNNKKKNEWSGFGIAILLCLVITTVIGISGANFIYMTTAMNSIESGGTTLLDKLLPTNKKNYFPQHKKTQHGGSASCVANKDYSTNWSMLSNIGVGTEGGWPYNIYKENIIYNGVIQNLKNWFSMTVANSYITNRTVLKKWLTLFNPKSREDSWFISLAPFIVAPLMLSIFSLIAIFIYIYFSSWYSAFKTGVGHTLFGMFFFYSWITTSCVSIVQILQYLSIMTILPLIADSTRIKNIIGCNLKSLSLLFGFLVCGSSLIYLEDVISITMFVAFSLMVVKSFF